MKSKIYPYSLSYTLAAILVMVVLMLLLFSNVVGSNSSWSWGIYGVFVLLFIFVCGLLVVKRLIPAIKGKPALELNETCIVDYIRNITINRADIKGVSLIRGRSSSLILVNLKWVSDYGSAIEIPLRFVKGKDGLIYNEVMEWFEDYGGLS